MENKTMPAVFVGHGSPMLALDHDAITQTLGELGRKIIADFGRPRAILMVSAHWYKNRNLVQRTEQPRQVFDMYGFPEELYQVSYQPKGCAELSDAVLAIPGLQATVDNSWGIDHGTWTPLVHMFPGATIPIVQLSVNGVIGAQGCYDLGRLLAPLRREGYLLMGSGNVVHNLRRVNWHSDHGSAEAEAFNRYITEAVERRDDNAIIHYADHPQARYAVPTADHFLPLLYMLGATAGDVATSEGKTPTAAQPLVFNNTCNLDAIAMTGYAFGM